MTNYLKRNGKNLVEECSDRLSTDKQDVVCSIHIEGQDSRLLRKNSTVKLSIEEKTNKFMNKGESEKVDERNKMKNKKKEISQSHILHRSI